MVFTANFVVKSYKTIFYIATIIYISLIKQQDTSTNISYLKMTS